MESLRARRRARQAARHPPPQQPGLARPAPHDCVTACLALAGLQDCLAPELRRHCLLIARHPGAGPGVGFKIGEHFCLRGCLLLCVTHAPAPHKHSTSAVNPAVTPCPCCLGRRRCATCLKAHACMVLTMMRDTKSSQGMSGGSQHPGACTHASSHVAPCILLHHYSCTQESAALLSFVRQFARKQAGPTLTNRQGSLRCGCCKGCLVAAHAVRGLHRRMCVLAGRA